MGVSSRGTHASDCSDPSCPRHGILHLATTCTTYDSFEAWEGVDRYAVRTETQHSRRV